MKAYMVFEFPEVTDLNGDKANEIVDLLVSLSVQQAKEFNALPPYKGFGPASVWVDDVVEEE